MTWRLQRRAIVGLQHEEAVYKDASGTVRQPVLILADRKTFKQAQPELAGKTLVVCQHVDFARAATVRAPDGVAEGLFSFLLPQSKGSIFAQNSGTRVVEATREQRLRRCTNTRLAAQWEASLFST